MEVTVYDVIYIPRTEKIDTTKPCDCGITLHEIKCMQLPMEEQQVFIVDGELDDWGMPEVYSEDAPTIGWTCARCGADLVPEGVTVHLDSRGGTLLNKTERDAHALLNKGCLRIREETYITEEDP